ncbi:MAG: hypothetical protein OXI76_16940 [Gemmatimonadota bacterium]|nr:hypothetical protein [Chloroflexota bacterium]MDE2679582.1 hypothetical protein [Gemmatimonadota bacterium]
MAAQQLQVLDVVHLEVAELEVRVATAAPPLLLAVEDVLVLPVGDGRVDVRSARDVRARRHELLVKQRRLVAQP